MSEKPSSNRVLRKPENYEIRTKGHLQDKWQERFEGMSITRKSDGTTTLFGPLPDQTALHSILLRIRNMNLKLLSINSVQGDLNCKNNQIMEVNLDDLNGI